MKSERTHDLRVFKKGPVARALDKANLLHEIIWEYQFLSQYTVADIQVIIEQLEMEPAERILERWCNGQNLIGFSRSILYVVDTIRKTQKKGKP